MAAASRTGNCSLQERRLRKSHQSAMAAAPIMGLQNMPMNWKNVPGATHPGTVMASHSRTIINTPGHRRGRGVAGPGGAADEGENPSGVCGAEGMGERVSLM